MDEHVHKEKLARINYKQVILVAVITAVTSITVTLISSGVFFKDETPTPRPITVDCDSYKEDNKVLKSELASAIPTGTLQDMSSRFFPKGGNPEEMKDSIKVLLEYSNQLSKHQSHYTFKLFLVQKIMLNKPRGNINTRIDNDISETYKIIQGILKDAGSYSGVVNGVRMDTYLALKEFQESINQTDSTYFNPDNYGIFGFKTLETIRRILESTNS